jgi:hypothetical protein
MPPVQPTPSTQTEGPPRGWWEHPWLLLALVLGAALPLLWPQTPPLVDLPGHIGRYRVQLGLEESPFLDRYYGFDWALIGNLGVDLLIELFAPIFGLELGVKLIVIAIPVMTVAGFLLVAREIHGRIPPTAFFALPLAYGYPFQFGFVNFALSIALALLAFPLWLRMGRSGRWRLRAALFVPISCLIWVCHTFGWGLLGLLVFAGETADQRDRHGATRLQAFLKGGLHCIPLALPFLLMLAWRSGAVAGENADWFNWEAKGRWLLSILKERWETWDKAGAILLMALPVLALVRLGFKFRHGMALATIFLILIFVLLPRIVFGSAYADMRLTPFLVAVAVLGITPNGWVERRLSGAIAVLALLFFVTRIAVTSWTFADLDRAWQGQLAALQHVPAGSRVLVQAFVPCNRAWRTNRMEHVGSMAIARRDAFTNDQWAMPGAQLIKVEYQEGAPFILDPSQIMRPHPRCRGYYEMVLPLFLQKLPPRGFDFVWFVDLPRPLWPDDGRLTPVWNGGRTGILYRLSGSATSASETPNGSDARPTR